MFGSTMLRKTRASLGAERARGLLGLVVELEQHGLHRAHDERQRHEEQREDDRGARERDVDADGRLRAVEREQRQARDDRRQRERQVDERVHEALAAEVVAHEHPRGDRPEHGVRRAATISAAPRLSFSAATASGAVDDRPELVQAVLARRPDERRDRQQRRSRERKAVDEAEREGRSGPLARSTCCCGARRRRCVRGASQRSVLRPPARSSTMRPLFGSNQTLSALRQPPMSCRRS